MQEPTDEELLEQATKTVVDLTAKLNAALGINNQNVERLRQADKTINELTAALTKATETIHQQAGQLGVTNGTIRFLAKFIKDNGLEPPALPDLLPPQSDLQN